MRGRQRRALLTIYANLDPHLDGQSAEDRRRADARAEFYGWLNDRGAFDPPIVRDERGPRGELSDTVRVALEELIRQPGATFSPETVLDVEVAEALLSLARRYTFENDEEGFGRRSFARQILRIDSVANRVIARPGDTDRNANTLARLFDTAWDDELYGLLAPAWGGHGQVYEKPRVDRNQLVDEWTTAPDLRVIRPPADGGIEVTGKEPDGPSAGDQTKQQDPYYTGSGPGEPPVVQGPPPTTSAIESAPAPPVDPTADPEVEAEAAPSAEVDTADSAEADTADSAEADTAESEAPAPTAAPTGDGDGEELIEVGSVMWNQIDGLGELKNSVISALCRARLVPVTIEGPDGTPQGEYAVYLVTTVGPIAWPDAGPYPVEQFIDELFYPGCWPLRHDFWCSMVDHADPEPAHATVDSMKAAEPAPPARHGVIEREYGGRWPVMIKEAVARCDADHEVDQQGLFPNTFLFFADSARHDDDGMRSDYFLEYRLDIRDDNDLRYDDGTIRVAVDRSARVDEVTVTISKMLFVRNTDHTTQGEVLAEFACVSGWAEHTRRFLLESKMDV